jgi:hypothetical protein
MKVGVIENWSKREQKKRWGGRKDRKIQRGRQNANKWTFLPITPLLRLCLVNYSRETKEKRTQREAERKDRKIQKGR